MSLSRYRINLEDALKECASSPEFFKRLKSGRYLYVDSCFCLNRPEYIQWNEDGVAELTSYAHEHQDECCLRFFVTVTGGWANEQGSSNPIFGYITNPVISDPHYRENKIAIQEHIKTFSAAKSEFLALAKKLPQGFSGMLDELIKWREVTEETLAEEAELSAKTIQRLRHDDPVKEVSLETIIQLCIGLHLPPMLSGYLLRAAGKSFMVTELHTAYQLLLSSCYDYTVADCNALLKSQRLPQLGKNPKP